MTHRTTRQSGNAGTPPYRDYEGDEEFGREGQAGRQSGQRPFDEQRGPGGMGRDDLGDRGFYRGGERYGDDEQRHIGGYDNDTRRGGFGQRRDGYAINSDGAGNYPHDPEHFRRVSGGWEGLGGSWSGRSQYRQLGVYGGGMPGSGGERSAIRAGSRGPKGWQRSDERVKDDICERLYADPHIDSSEVSVEVKDGKVSLEGSVTDRSTKHAIEDLVDGCPGVKDIENRIHVGSGEKSTLVAGSHSTQSSGPSTAQPGTSSGSGQQTNHPGTSASSSGAPRAR